MSAFETAIKFLSVGWSDIFRCILKCTVINNFHVTLCRAHSQIIITLTWLITLMLFTWCCTVHNGIEIVLLRISWRFRIYTHIRRIWATSHIGLRCIGQLCDSISPYSVPENSLPCSPSHLKILPEDKSWKFCVYSKSVVSSLQGTPPHLTSGSWIFMETVPLKKVILILLEGPAANWKSRLCEIGIYCWNNFEKRCFSQKARKFSSKFSARLNTSSNSLPTSAYYTHHFKNKTIFNFCNSELGLAWRGRGFCVRRTSYAGWFL